MEELSFDRLEHKKSFSELFLTFLNFKLRYLKVNIKGIRDKEFSLRFLIG